MDIKESSMERAAVKPIRTISICGEKPHTPLTKLLGKGGK